MDERSNETPVLELKEFAPALIGYAIPTATSERLAVYDYDRMVSLITERTGCTDEEAKAVIRIRYQEKYLGTASPVFCKRNGGSRNEDRRSER